MFSISVAGAFLGGVLALLSPCSALLLPSFFAYAFTSTSRLFARTLLFYAGLCTLLVPLGIGASFAGAIVLDHRATAIAVAGALLILFGLVQLSGAGFSFIPRRFWVRRITDSALSVYGTGVVYGFAGFCSGPLLGAVLTMAAGAATPFVGAGLLAVYALGMAAPLFLLAALWDRYDLGRRPWLRGKAFTIAGRTVHTSNLLSGALFIAIGLTFLLTEGTAALEGVYDALGLVELSFRAQLAVARVDAFLARLGVLPFLVLLAAAAALVAYRRRQGRNAADRGQ